MSEDDEFEILCRNREEYINDYLMVVSDCDEEWCRQMAIVMETLYDEDPYPLMVSPKEELIYD